MTRRVGFRGGGRGNDGEEGGVSGRHGRRLAGSGESPSIQKWCGEREEEWGVGNDGSGESGDRVGVRVRGGGVIPGRQVGRSNLVGRLGHLGQA